jgi:hypothetical protein
MRADTSSSSAVGGTNGPERTSGTMRAIVRDRYGETEVLRLEEVLRPLPGDHDAGMRQDRDHDRRGPRRVDEPGADQASSRAATPAGNPPVAMGPQRVGVIRINDLSWMRMAWRYSSQSGCSPEMQRK